MQNETLHIHGSPPAFQGFLAIDHVREKNTVHLEGRGKATLTLGLPLAGGV